MVLDCTEATAWYFGQIKSQLKSAGRPIPDNDMWIAACAQEYSLSLVTRDSHFGVVPNIHVLSW
jgi:predicted nucleic acid-binding protein